VRRVFERAARLGFLEKERHGEFIVVVVPGLEIARVRIS
jgi:hypothetical protein